MQRLILRRKRHFHDWIGDGWVVLFSHPKDFTPVCTTELGYMAKIKPEFDKRGVKITSSSQARCRTTTPRSSTRRVGRRRKRICA